MEMRKKSGCQLISNSLALFIILLCLLGATQVAAQVEHIVNGTFASGPSGWTLTGNFQADTRFSSCRSCPGYAYLALADGSAGDNLVGTISQGVTIPSGATSATLTFWVNITTQETSTIAYDVLNVTLQNSSGGYLATVVVLSNANAGGYRQLSYDLLPYRGQTIRVHFSASTDSSLPTTFRVDDVSVVTTTPTNYTITLSASPSAGGTVSGGGTFAAGSSRTVTATANSGYTFANWTQNGSVVSTAASYTFTLTANRTLVANFCYRPVEGAAIWLGAPSTFTPISRSTIESTATAMINYSWTPAKTIKNWEGPNACDTYTFTAGTSYTGVAYTQHNPQQSLTYFANAVSTTPGGTVAYGNDCSGFVSIAWNLPVRYNTGGFESDATSSGGYVISRGDIGSTPNTILLSGDALVRSGDHMVLFKERTINGIMTREQTPHNARSIVRDWAFFDQYRPIRRNSMDENLYTGSLSATGSIAYHPNNTYYYSSASGIHSGRLGGPNNSTNFNLYLWKWNSTNGSWQVVASSTGSYSSETINYSGTPGYYMWGVYLNSGSGNYELSIKKP